MKLQLFVLLVHGFIHAAAIDTNGTDTNAIISNKQLNSPKATTDIGIQSKKDSEESNPSKAQTKSEEGKKDNKDKPDKEVDQPKQPEEPKPPKKDPEEPKPPKKDPEEPKPPKQDPEEPKPPKKDPEEPKPPKKDPEEPKPPKKDPEEPKPPKKDPEEPKPKPFPLPDITIPIIDIIKPFPKPDKPDKPEKPVPKPDIPSPVIPPVVPPPVVQPPVSPEPAPIVPPVVPVPVNPVPVNPAPVSPPPVESVPVNPQPVIPPAPLPKPDNPNPAPQPVVNGTNGFGVGQINNVPIPVVNSVNKEKNSGGNSSSDSPAAVNAESHPNPPAFPPKFGDDSKFSVFGKTGVVVQNVPNDTPADSPSRKDGNRLEGNIVGGQGTGVDGVPLGKGSSPSESGDASSNSNSNASANSITGNSSIIIWSTVGMAIFVMGGFVAGYRTFSEDKGDRDQSISPKGIESAHMNSAPKDLSMERFSVAPPLAPLAPISPLADSRQSYLSDVSSIGYVSQPPTRLPELKEQLVGEIIAVGKPQVQVYNEVHSPILNGYKAQIRNAESAIYSDMDSVLGKSNSYQNFDNSIYRQSSITTDSILDSSEAGDMLSGIFQHSSIIQMMNTPNDKAYAVAAAASVVASQESTHSQSDKYDSMMFSEFGDDYVDSSDEDN